MQVPSPITVMKGSWHLPTPPAPQAGVPAVGFPPTPTIPSYPPPTIPHHPPVQWPATSTLPPPSAQFITTPPPSLPASHPPPIGYPATSAIPYGAPPWLGPRMPPYLTPPPVRATVSSWSGDPSANSTYGVMPPPQGWPGTAMPATSAEYSTGSHGSYNPPMYSATSATDASSFLPKKDQQLYESSSTKYSSSDRSGCDKTSIEKQRRTDKSTRRKRHRRSRSPISRHRRRSVDGASRRSHSSHRSRDHKKIRERRRSSSDRQRHRKPRSRSLTRDTSSDRLRHHRRTSPSRRRSPRRESYSRQRDRSLSRTHSPVRISRESSKSRVELSSRKKHSERERDREREKGGQIHSHPTSPEMPEELDVEKELEGETNIWTRCSPADLYYQRSTSNPKLIVATAKLTALHERFKTDLLERADRVRKAKPKYEVVQRQQKLRVLKPVHSESSSSSSEDEVSSDDDTAVEELERKRKHPDRLHEELWYNDAGEMNDGPLCRCSARARRSGIRHGIYPGEHHLGVCAPNTNNADRLYHYRITMFPHTNFLTKTPTIIKHDGHEFIFEGFSLFAHYKLDKLPTCKVIRFNIEYTIVYIEESLPENFTINCLELFSSFLFHEVLELVDLNLKAHSDPGGCNRFHLMPRFVRSLEDNGKEILSMNNVLVYLLNSSRLLVEETELANLLKMNQFEWQNFADEVKGMIATYPGMKPCSIRVDQLDRDQVSADVISYPEIVHFGIRPLQLSYAGNPNYQKAWREYVKYRHLLANKPKVLYPDRHKLILKEMRLQEMRTKSNLKRDVTVVVSSQGFCRTGIMCDIVQHAMLIPVLVCHLRFHKSLDILEANIGHCFKDRYLLQLALTHPSYRENFGTNPDHARNSLTNCGIRQPEYGDRRIHYMNTRKRGINTLINIMSRFGKHEETVSNINHNERLEFLGDAVVEFLTSIHLYHLFPDIEEGGLATYRAAIVQNQHLAVLAKKLQLEKYMLYAHGSDLCHDLELRHAMANCLEALMGSLFLDGGIDAADRVFSHTLFSEIDLLDIWINYPHHPLQEQEPEGDRKYIESVPLLQKLTKFEDAIGVQFTHVRLLARAFTHRSVGYNNLTLGSNQRLEFLGDTVLQLVASEYLYKYFPEHHEGHLSLLRSSLVNNRTQAVVCDDLGMVDYAIYAYPKGELKTKDRADLLEAFLGALYVDKGLEFCRVFCQVCFFPRLQVFIMNQDWNDPKSKLQQCCLTLRTMDGGEPDIPVYKVIECKGPTNTRIFTVAVYFRGERLAKGSGHSIQQAEMAAAGKALESSKDRYQVKYSTNPLFVLLNKQSCSHN